MSVTDAMIVAGGRGTRLQPLTYTTPKPLVPFCGAPFLSGVIDRLGEAGIERVFLVVGADTEPLRDRSATTPARMASSWSMVPEPEPLDTAGGVRSALDLVDGPFLVLNGDILTDVDLTGVIAAHEQAGADATIVLTRVDDTSSFGVCVREGGRTATGPARGSSSSSRSPSPGSLPGQDAVNAGHLRAGPRGTGPLSRGASVLRAGRSSRASSRDGGHIEGVV